ncbi:MAG: alpha-galactosidase [Phycisphaeraceae bacterium]|nr:alpha-galactosidase [Phycisphaeraceae bacterium]
MAQGIETDTDSRSGDNAPGTALVVSMDAPHQRLIQVVLRDVTDDNNQLVQTREWLLHHKDVDGLALTGNLFAAECTMTGRGKVFIKRAPLPHVRQADGPPVDLAVEVRRPHGYNYTLCRTGPEDLESWVVLDYDGGAIGRTRALHHWQQSLRPATESHALPQFLSNSWGDRNRDARIQEGFMLEEIDRAAELGVDVVQIDDGWQKGRTANSAEAEEKGGVWTGFWEADPDFWAPDPERFPNGLEPLLERAKEHGLEIGLWYAPDSHRAFANWERDVDQIITLHETYGVNHFKLDSIVAETHAARRNLAAMFQAILDRSEGKIVCDLDVTAGKRPGYFGELTIGPLFVENRYTDWHSYWPHFTLRNLWQLSHWIDPRRLRMELLNNGRNTEKYADDPLAPALYPPSTLFAIVMFSNPLGWFENTGLSDDYVADVAPLVACWKEHRPALFDGDILPIGEVPDGVSWTGFLSDGGEGRDGYAVVLNEKNPSKTHRFSLPRSFGGAGILWGDGEVEVDGDQLTVTIEKPFGAVFVKLLVDDNG